MAQLTELAGDFAAHCIEAERTLLAAGWFDEIGWNDATFVAGLRYEHFLDPGHAFQFGYLCQSADEGLATAVLESPLPPRAQGSL